MFLSRIEATNIGHFVAEETRRQGDGPLDVGYMLQAWYEAIEQWERQDRLSLDHIIGWAKQIDPMANSGFERFRTGPIWIGLDKRTEHGIERRMEQWLEAVNEGYFVGGLWTVNDMYGIREGEATGNELAYKAFEDIHPFFDGNGRTGKVIFNWLEGTLRDPKWPSVNFWGSENL